MRFNRRARDGIRRGEITCAVRSWKRPRVQVGQRFPLAHGQIEVETVAPLTIDDLTPAIARRAGFDTVEALRKIARHDGGRGLYLIAFRYLCARNRS